MSTIKFKQNIRNIKKSIYNVLYEHPSVSRSLFI